MTQLTLFKMKKFTNQIIEEVLERKIGGHSSQEEEY